MGAGFLLSHLVRRNRRIVFACVITWCCRVSSRQLYRSETSSTTFAGRGSEVLNTGRPAVASRYG
jgi:hypothetical protein